MHSLPNWRVLIPFLVALVAGLVVAWSSSAASDPATTANATGGSIAVVGNGLYRRFPDGRLALLTEDGRAPAWSHDGRQIAFVRLIDTGLSRVCPLFVMNSDGSDVRQVGQANTDCSGVSWGPGDRQIVFGGAPPANYAVGMGLWIVNANGSGLRRLRAGRGATEGIHPTWSPDGRWIVFGWTGRSPHPWGRLAAVRPDGTGYRVLVKPRAGQARRRVDLPGLVARRQTPRLRTHRPPARARGEDDRGRRRAWPTPTRAPAPALQPRSTRGPYLVAERAAARLLGRVWPGRLCLDRSEPRRSTACAPG